MLSWEDFDQDETLNNQAEKQHGKTQQKYTQKKNPKIKDPLKEIDLGTKKDITQDKFSKPSQIGITRH